MARLSKRLTNFPDLPSEFVEWIKRKGKQRMTLAELVEEYEKFKRASGVY